MHAKWWGIWLTQPVFLHLHLGSGLEAPAWCPWPNQSRSLAAARLLRGTNLIWWAANVAARASPRMFWLVSQMNTWKQRGAWDRLNELDRLPHLVNMLQASFMFWARFQSGSLFDSNQIAPHKSQTPACISITQMLSLQKKRSLWQKHLTNSNSTHRPGFAAHKSQQNVPLCLLFATSHLPPPWLVSLPQIAGGLQPRQLPDTALRHPAATCTRTTTNISLQSPNHSHTTCPRWDAPTQPTAFSNFPLEQQLS